MLDKLTGTLDFQSRALLLRAERQRTIASNIANVDTPGYVGRDFDFPTALRAANAGAGTQAAVEFAAGGTTTDARHIPLPAVAHTASTTSLGRPAELGYAVQSQPNLDQNTVDIDRERANFVDNSVRYEAALRFINGQSRTMLTAIQGQ
ncbi:flagellar basal body rod protein FlgB [Xylophilus sp.]|uniref:flagellar basal body rod protein FlgB n=1 Tax=Xylophilus sp. TaxID=2653893 RepID=UPI0013B89DB6|nr:flagellar basal body rod protein FlgB [Xylophilus sp.]KAF1044610.1 MAG: Flagellar basal body rod protein FlgB [Xylophilus sp.]